ncbi:hypothetical protein [Frankia sp. CiP3]|uniref:hypothetical protein n=1 Tax=Frankia sp. CiP3 TaxID=2880971 RepID=UPI001EF72049|nr:hypothetical protein [Frankia sp. CiP3]
MTIVDTPLVDCQDALRAYAELWSGAERIAGLRGGSHPRDDTEGLGRLRLRKERVIPW